MKKILLLTTGGTIASVRSEEGTKPQLNSEELLSFIPEIKGKYDVTAKPVLNMDSSDFGAEEFITIAKAIWENKDSCSGIVVTHGTDTMGYSTSATSFMLQKLNIPVVFTGAQIPITEPNSDGNKNLIDAITVANSGIMGGIYVVFDGKIIRGIRASKVKSMDKDGFQSINTEYVGTVENSEVIINNNNHIVQTELNEPCFELETKVFLFKITPTTEPDILDFVIERGYKGVIIEALGMNGFNTDKRTLFPKILEMLEKNIAVVVKSQCTYGGSNLGRYYHTMELEKAGAIPAYDMSTECVVTKLMWALKNKDKSKTIKDIMLTNYCGEISE